MDNLRELKNYVDDRSVVRVSYCSDNQDDYEEFETGCYISKMEFNKITVYDDIGHVFLENENGVIRLTGIQGVELIKKFSVVGDIIKISCGKLGVNPRVYTFVVC